MKKIALAILSISVVLVFVSCTWHIPQKVSVKSQAEYNFSLGTFEEDLNSKFSVKEMLKDVSLPNNGKIYDYWPKKNALSEQRFLMYMPLMEIPVDISQYFDKGAIADSIKNISFEKDIEVPSVDFNYTMDIELDQVNEQVCNNFKLAGPITSYNASTFSQIYNMADNLSFAKGKMVIKAYTLSTYNPSASIDSLITGEDDTYTGSVSITSNGKTISGYFYGGTAELDLADFDFKTSDISISFGNPTLTKAFKAVIDTSDKNNRPYQIKSVSGLTMTQPITFDVTQKIDAISGFDAVEACTIDTGKLILDFAIPAGWKNINPEYEIELSGGINLDSGVQTTALNPANISLNGKSISAEEITAKVEFNIAIANATIDFTKKPTISIGTNISKIATVTVKLSDQSLSFDNQQALPDEVLNVVKSIALNQCGVKGTFTNTLPEGNDISMSVYSKFFDIHSTQNTSAGKVFEVTGNTSQGNIEILSEETSEPRLVKLAKSPSAADEYKEFDFKVDVTLPGGDSKKITVNNVEPNKTYRFAINLEPVIDWEYVMINFGALPSASEPVADTIGTGFNPSTIFSSMDKVLGNDFADKIEIPECKLYLYITKPEGINALNALSFANSSIKMFYGDTPAENSGNKPTKIGTDAPMVILGSSDTPDFTSVPNFTIEKDEDGNEIVISRATDNPSLCVGLSDLLKPTAASKQDGAQLCVDYSIQLGGATGTGDIKITSAELDNTTSGSIGIYALIDLPLKFKATDVVDLDFSSITGKDSGNSSASASVNSSSSNSSATSEFSKYLDIVQEINVRYVANKLPVTASDGLSIGIDLFGDDTSMEWHKLVTDGTKDTIEVDTEIVDRLKSNPDSISPKIKMRIAKDTVLALPRDKSLNLYAELGLKTDGTIQVK